MTAASKAVVWTVPGAAADPRASIREELEFTCVAIGAAVAGAESRSS